MDMQYGSQTPPKLRYEVPDYGLRVSESAYPPRVPRGEPADTRQHFHHRQLEPSRVVWDEPQKVLLLRSDPQPTLQTLHEGDHLQSAFAPLGAPRLQTLLRGTGPARPSISDVRSQNWRELRRVAHAEVHALPSHGRVDMRCVAEQAYRSRTALGVAHVPGGDGGVRAEAA